MDVCVRVCVREREKERERERESERENKERRIKGWLGFIANLTLYVI